jgi:hypothetical protein
MKLKNILLPVLVCFFTISCNKDDNAQSITPPTSPITFDCVAGSGAEEFIVTGDPYNTFTPPGYPPFNGYADPSIRKEPNSNRIWLAYSFPHIKQVDSNYVPSVAIHLAKSEDLGSNWSFVKKLFEPIRMNNPANTSQAGYLDHEVINLLPVSTSSTTDWLAVRLNYFVPTIGGFAARPNNSFYISIVKSTSPDNLDNGQVGTIGGNLTHAAWNANTTLIPPDLAADYFFWNEPALYFDASNGKLYLIMVAFVYNGSIPIMSKNNVYVYSTTPTGNPNSWNWQLNGTLVNSEIANELGGERVSQVDLTKGADGKLLLVCSPDDLNIAQNDFNHKGCKVLEIKSLENPSLERDTDGKLKIRTIITASNANDLGSAASSYDAASATGILFTKRIKNSTQFTTSIWKTKLKP